MNEWKIVTLEETTGLSYASPLQSYLKCADECLRGMDFRSWYQVHKVLPVIDLFAGLFHFVGHPCTQQAQEEHLDKFCRWLWENGEIVLSLLVTMLQQRSLSPDAIRLVFMFIIANLGTLKEKEDRLRVHRHRSIDDDWYGEQPDTEWKVYLTLQLPETPVE